MLHNQNNNGVQLLKLNRIDRTQNSFDFVFSERFLYSISESVSFQDTATDARNNEENSGQRLAQGEEL